MAETSEGPKLIQENDEQKEFTVDNSSNDEGNPKEYEETCFGSVEIVSKALKPKSVTAKMNTGGSAKRKIEAKTSTDPKTVGAISVSTKPTMSSASRISGSVPVTRKSKSGGLPEKKPISITKRQSSDIGSAAARRASSLVQEPLRKSLPDLKRNSVSSVDAKAATGSSTSVSRKSAPISPFAKMPWTPTSSTPDKQDSVKSSMVSPASSISSIKKTSSPGMGSSGSISSIRKSVSRDSPHPIHSPTISSMARSGSLSTSLDRSHSSSGHKKMGTPQSRDTRLVMLPQVDIKASDDVRLDLRGRKIRSLKRGSGINWSADLEFVYLRDNLLCTLEGIEALTRVKVLDLSFNDFKGPGFEPLLNCKALQQLYLAGNQITSLKSLPELPNLEFLSVAQNKLKSLSMASQPRLQVLAASKNKISTLKGFPYLPILEHLRLEENPILKMSHLEAASILLVGPTLKKFNDRDLSREEVALTKRYPSHTGLCIRNGWDFCRPEQAVDSTFKFLLEQWKEHLPSGYLLKKAAVDRPFEEDACGCHFEFVRDIAEECTSVLELKYQWFLGDKSLSKFIAIDGACGEIYFPKHDEIGKILKIECTPIQGDTIYTPVFAISSPVSPGTRIPKVLKIDVRGNLVEGNTIRGYAEVTWCGGTPGKGVSSWLRRRWNGTPVIIAGAEEEEYKLILEDVGSCLVYMYTPVSEEGAKGEPQYLITDFVKAAPPSVNNVQITGDPVEGNTLRGVGEYFGGKEGSSTYEWRREEKDTRDLTVVLKGTNEYTLTKEDVARRLIFVYIPVNFEGKEGNSMSATTQVIRKAPPKVTSMKIIGELKEGHKVTVTGIVSGGTEASSRVQWFKICSSTFEGENTAEPLTTSKIAKAFRIPLGAVGHYLVAKFTPMTPDGEAGVPVYVISEAAVEMLPPSLNFLSITGDYSEGEVLTASYGYIGGHEGMCIYNWYLHKVENDLGTLIPEASGLLQYRISKDAIGRFISFACTPVRNDGILGERRIFVGQERVRPGSPRLLSLQVTGTAVEGTTLNVEKKYWGGDEGESIYRWFRTSSSGPHDEISGATASSHMLSIDDVGFFILVSCEPIRSDGARGPIVLSEEVGPIVPGLPTCTSLQFHGSLVEGERLTAISSYSGGVRGDCLCEWFRVKGNGQREKLQVGEYLDLTCDEVGYCVELVYTPTRADGLKGSPKKLISLPVAPGDPRGIELVVPDGCEGQELVPKTRYFGGREGVSKYIWFRSKNKLHESALMELLDTLENVEICGQALMYTPSRKDVDSYLALYWVPARSDGEFGRPLVSISESPVIPALPLISNVCVKKLSSSTYCGEGEYIGGYEGASLFSWYRKYEDGTTLLVDGANSRTYEVSEEDYSCRLLFGYTPVRSDSTSGEIRLSDPTNLILPELPRIDMLALTGKAVEGQVLTALEVIPKTENQQLVWTKYKKQVIYRWFFSSENGNEASFELYPSQRSCSYKVRFEEIGGILRCECIVTDVFGRSSEPAYAETSVILPGFPKIDKLEIEGRGFHTNLYAVKGIYTGGKEGKSSIQWLRSMVGSPDLISIPGETGRMYEANVDDVGYRLVAVYTPIRDDGTEGEPVSASTDPISVEPDVHKEVKQKLDVGSVKFEALCDKDRSPKMVPGMVNLERRILEVNRKRVKVVKPGSKTSFPSTEIRGSYSPPFHVVVFRNDQHRLRIVVDGENEVDLMVQTRHLRDVIVLVIRGLAQRFNSTSLNTLLKLEV